MKQRFMRRKLYGLLLAIFLCAGAGVVISEAVATKSLTLSAIADIELPGRASRFDYQSYDPSHHLLFIAHMGDSKVTVFNTELQTVIGQIDNSSNVHGVLAIPAINKVYASATGRNSIVSLDAEKLLITASMPGGKYPDGLAYAPGLHKLYVSDEMGEAEIVIDTISDTYLTTIPLKGEAGNSQYDPVSGHIFVNVQTKNDLVEIDPKTDHIIARHALPGADHNHGLLIDPSRKLAFVACKGNATLLVVDMQAFSVLAKYSVGDDPDVLAFDPVLSLLYIASESGVLSVFEVDKDTLRKVWEERIDPNAHSVFVDPKTHRVYLPLKNVNGRPVLRILTPSKSTQSSS